MKKVIFVLVIIAMMVISYKLDKSQTQKFASDMEQLKEMQIQLDAIAEEQLNQAQQIQKLEDDFKGSLGKASWYDYTLPSGWSSVGHRVCASRDFPRQSTIKVINIANGKSVECLVTDFGPDKSVHPDRIVDMSSYAFSQIADTSTGIINVQIIKQ